MHRTSYLVRRNWEFWIVCWLFSVLDVLVVVVDCVIVVLTLIVLVRLVALRAVSSCCLAACACCRSNCSCICSCCNCEAEGPEELSCPPAERLTPDSWDKSSAKENKASMMKDFQWVLRNRMNRTQIKSINPFSFFQSIKSKNNAWSSWIKP